MEMGWTSRSAVLFLSLRVRRRRPGSSTRPLSLHLAFVHDGRAGSGAADTPVTGEPRRRRWVPAAYSKN